jgi:hypothetical protein
LKEKAVKSIDLGHHQTEFTQNNGEILFNRPVKIWKDSPLVLNLA